MNIHSTGKNKFVVELTRKDMQELDITYEEMDYSKIETRRVIWTILQKVRDSLGRDVDPSGNMLIEVAADTYGGCILSFTISEKRRGSEQRQPLRLTKAADNLIYEFDNQNDLLDAMALIKIFELKGISRLFKKGEKFRLVLSQLPCAECRKALEEFSHPLGKDVLTLSFTLEHWQPVGSV